MYQKEKLTKVYTYTKRHTNTQAWMTGKQLTENGWHRAAKVMEKSDEETMNDNDINYSLYMLGKSWRESFWCSGSLSFSAPNRGVQVRFPITYNFLLKTKFCKFLKGDKETSWMGSEG